MKKLSIILYIMVLILLISFVYATDYIPCYQEFANVSTSCGGLSTGSYSADSATSDQNRYWDGDWSTGDFPVNNGDNISINYTKPASALDSSKWSVSYGIDDNTINQTVNSSCLDQTPVQLRIYWLDPNSRFLCYTGSHWTELNVSFGSAQSIINEEAMTWNLSDITNLSLTFRDETTNTLITGETFTVYLEKSDFSQTYSATTNPYTIPDLDVDLYTQLKVSSTNYPEKQYLNIDLRDGQRNVPVNFTVYLINTTDSAEKTFNIVDEALNPLEDVRTVFTRIINGTATTIAEEESDFAGQVILNLDENYEYTINFSKENYEDKIISLEPTDSEYVITMISTIGRYNQSVYEGIRYKFEPSNTVLNNNTKYNFTFTLNSSVWDVTGCALYLRNGSTLLSSTASFTSNSCFLRIEQDSAGMTNITSEAVYQLDSTLNFTVSQQYRVIYTYEGDFSLKNFLDDLSDFGMAGFDDFGRMILALIVIFVITVLAAQKIGFTNPEVLILLVIAQVWFFSYVNWLYLDFTPIPTIAGFDLKKYILAILISLAGGAFIMRKFTD